MIGFRLHIKDRRNTQYIIFKRHTEETGLPLNDIMFECAEQNNPKLVTNADLYPSVHEQLTGKMEVNKASDFIAAAKPEKINKTKMGAV